MNLRNQLQSDLKYIRNDWWIPIKLIAPDKTVYEFAKGTTDILLGDVRKESKEFDPDIGGLIVVKKLSITIRLLDLERIPIENEQWFIQYPENLLDDGTMITGAFNHDNVSVGGETMGWIKIYPQEVEV